MDGWKWYCLLMYIQPGLPFEKLVVSSTTYFVGCKNIRTNVGPLYNGRPFHWAGDGRRANEVGIVRGVLRAFIRQAISSLVILYSLRILGVQFNLNFITSLSAKNVSIVSCED